MITDYMSIPFTFTKKNLIFDQLHSQLPIPIKSKNGFYVYISSRDQFNQSYVKCINLDKNFVVDKIENVQLSFGKHKEFDENGIMGSCIVGNYFYYTGWSKNRIISQPYSHSIGLAKILNHVKFEKIGSIILSKKDDNFLCSSPFVLKRKIWKMWFISGKDCDGWTEHGPLYTIHYAESNDGINWKEEKMYFPRKKNEIFARPFVFYENEEYYMLYTWMVLDNEKKYKIGIANSKDGINWNRITDEFLSCSKQGWDSEMIAFPYLLDNLLFYSGNSFGKGGFGYAKRL